MGEHYSELSGLLARVRNRWRAVAALRAWTITAAVASVVFALALFTERLAAPEGFTVVALWLAAVAAAFVSLAWMAVPLRRTPADRQIARFIEECCPELEDALVTAIAERGASAPGAMAEIVVGDAVRRTRGLDVDRIVSRRALRQLSMRAAAATIVLLIIGVISIGPAGHAARVFALYLFPESLVLDVIPGDVKVRAGESLKIVATLTGGIPGLVPVLRTSEEAGVRDTRMEPVGNAFALGFDNLDEGFRYSITAAGTTTREYVVTVIRPPRVEQINLRYEYPKAFGLEPRQDEDGGDIYGPVGTRVYLAVHADKPIAEAALTLADGKKIPLNVQGNVLEGELTIADDGSYRVALLDGDGLNNPGETEYFIRTLEDRPPDVRIIKPASDRKATAIEEVTIDARADDDFGVAALDLVYAVRGGEEKVVPFERSGSGPTVNGRRTVYLEDLAVQPGDFVTYYARARDVSRGKRSTEARSDIFFIEVTPFEEEFVASQSQGGGAGSQDERSIEDLVESQKEIITATWKLDRRARDARGRSQEDIKSIAGAQAELRKRALNNANQMRRANDVRRRRSALAGRGSSPALEASDDAMTKAADAMGRAQEQLEALSTSAALPHEMAALNELLRAQAEVRRREVQRQQQQFSNGTGQNRQQQDLSSLFDRELARQQQTNYETPNTRETREEQRDQNDELEKVRELARRQDALNREQQDLAKNRQGMSDEEVKRQLEKLTREQTELRRQAEELAQKLQQAQQAQGKSGQQGKQGKQGGQGSQGGQSQQAGRAMQEASEEMQQAANELRRQDAGQAAQRGNRALERLRDLERQMRSAQPDDRRRALGEMQLESRQLAEAQRRLADESQRGRGNEADNARRRAGEQDRLADRMQRLERSVRQMAGEGRQDQPGQQGQQGQQEQPGQPGQAGQRGQQGQQAEAGRNALDEAARDLERQRLSERMRTAARSEREAAAQGTQAESNGRMTGQQTPRSGQGQPQQGQAQQGQPQAQGQQQQGQGQPAQGQQGQQGQQAPSPQGRAAADGQRAGARTQEGQAIARELDRLAERLGAANGQGGESDQLSEQLSRIRDLREQLSQLERQLSELSKSGEGQGQQPGDRNAQNTQNGQGQGPPMGSGDNTPWDGARDLLDDMRRDLEYQTPTADEFNPGRSAPGTEAWKQDFSQWEELKVQLAAALERAENNTAARLRTQQVTDRLNAGAAQGVPDKYRRLVDQYYRALASPKERK